MTAIAFGVRPSEIRQEADSSQKGDESPLKEYRVPWGSLTPNLFLPLSDTDRAQIIERVGDIQFSDFYLDGVTQNKGWLEMKAPITGATATPRLETSLTAHFDNLLLNNGEVQNIVIDFKYSSDGSLIECRQSFIDSFRQSPLSDKDCAQVGDSILRYLDRRNRAIGVAMGKEGAEQTPGWEVRPAGESEDL